MGKFAKSAFVFLLVALILLSNLTPVFASTKSWDFSSSSDYTFDNTKIEISAGQAQLKQTSDWYDPSWLYRRAITIDNTGNSSDLTGFQEEIKLTSSNFDFTKAKSDGSDIRFTDSNGTTLIDHWTEVYDSANQSAFLMVEVPSITASSSKTIYMYYGNSVASSTSSWDNTFITSPSSLSTGDIYTQSTYDAFPATELLQNGNILVAFRSGSTHVSYDGEINIETSTDNGSTWSSPSTAVSAISGVNIRVDAGLKQISNGTIFLPFYKYSSDNIVTSWITKSTDNGSTWSAPAQITSNLLNVEMDTYGKIVELPNGNLLMPALGYHTGDTALRSALLISTDFGNTWTDKATIAYDGLHDFSETSILCLDANNCLAVMRSSNSTGIHQANSSDGGNTWTNPISLFDGVSPDLMKLSNNDLLLCVGDRTRTTGIRCHISHDSGSSWSPGTMVFTQSGNYSTVNLGYPSSVQLPNGNIFTAYYYSSTTVDIAKVVYSENFIIDNNSTNFFEGMEAGNLTNWSVVEGTTTSVSSSVKHTGNYSFYINDTVTTPLNKGILEMSPAGKDTGAVSFWLYPSAITSAISFMLQSGLNSFGDERFWFFIMPDGSVRYYNNCSADLALPTPVTIPMGIWTKFTLKFNSSINQAEIFINGISKGTVNKCYAGGSIKNIEFASGSSADTGDIFYVDDIYTHQYASIMPSSTVGAEVTHYDISTPSINPKSSVAQPFTSLSAFSETATKNGGEIKYQLSNDSGTTWYWWNGSAWTGTSSGYTEASLASDINDHISTLPLGSKSLLFKAYLHSDGTQLVQLDSVNLTYANDTTAPTTSSSPSGGTYNTAKDITLTCADNSGGSGCDQIYYTTNGVDPTTGSSHSASPINLTISANTTLKFFAKDLAGNSEDIKTESYTIDTTAPETTINSHPASPINSASATFTFSASETSSFQCKIDSGDYATCSSPKNYTGLADGSHSFSVKATDTAGNEDQTPASFSWTIDSVIPVLTEVSAIDNPTNDPTPDYIFHSTKAGTISYSGLCDSGNHSAISGDNTVSFNTLSEATYHNCKIQVTDSANNASNILTVPDFRVDITAPTVTDNGSPSGELSAGTTSATLKLTTSEDSLCNYSQNSGDNFYLMTHSFTTTGNTDQQEEITGLGAGTYHYYAKCQDLADNVTANDFEISFSIASPPPADNNSDSGDDHHDSKKKKTVQKRKISHVSSMVANGSVITPTGKRFSKKSFVLLYFSNSRGVFYLAKRVTTDAKGNFSVSLLIKKPRGFYSWYAVDVKSGRKSKVKHYKVI